MRLRDGLIAIQEGRAPDEFGWMHHIGGPRRGAELAGASPAVPRRSLLADSCGNLSLIELGTT
jgi:hypothetical protein